MNIEYLKLADGKTVVTDEKGTIKVIDDEISGSELLAENKLDVLNNDIKASKRNIENNKEISGLARTMLLILPIIAIASILIGVLAGGAYGALMCLIGVSGACIPTIGVFLVANQITKKKIKGYTAKLRKAEELKKEANEKVIKEYEPINKPISLLEDNKKELFLIDKQLNSAYDSATKQKTKRRILERKKR